MIEFTWASVQKGDKVRVVANKEQLEEICVEEFHNYVGNVSRVQDKYITVKFVNDTRMFEEHMLEKVKGDSIDTYDEWLNSPEGSLLYEKYMEEYSIE